MDRQCSVCLRFFKEFQNICSFNNRNEQWLFLLKSVVPEVDWLETYKICHLCASELDRVSAFRKMCILLDEQRKSFIKVIEETKEETKPELFKCFHCNEDFTDKELLAAHITQTHTKSIKLEENTFNRCSKCGKKYNLLKSLKNHSKACNGPVVTNPQFKCENCSKFYTTKKTLRVHQKSCEPKAICEKTRSFSCEICGDSFSLPRQVFDHCEDVHNIERKLVKPYTCDICPVRFVSSANLIQHKKYHNGTRSNICSICGKSYITKSDLTVHEYTHFNKRNHKCKFCDKAFNTNQNKRTHILVVHTEPGLWKYECDQCGKKFPLKSGYEQHMRRHAGDKRFPCQICEKLFISKSELKKHMVFHSKARPFECSHCGKSYKEQGGYKIHLKKAHGVGDAKIPVRVKKHLCDVCSKSFVDRSKLKRHLCTHTGEKPFLCNKCDRKFADSHQFKQHMTAVHREEKDAFDGSFNFRQETKVEVETLVYTTLQSLTPIV